MSTAEQWASALAGVGNSSFVLRFERMGLDAQCRPLSAGEVEECVRMGGERGLRYALYLACDDLREAGESMKKQGTVASAFDITERLSYGDVLAAGAAILNRSGVDTAAVSLEGGEDAAQGQAMALAEVFAEVAGGNFPSVGDDGGASARSYPSGMTAPVVLRSLDIWDFADRLWAAAGNR